MSEWIIWAILALGPTILLLLLGARALRKRSGEAWDDFRHFFYVAGWLLPGLAVLSGHHLCALLELPHLLIALLATLGLITFPIALSSVYLLRWTAERGFSRGLVRYSVGYCVRLLGEGIAVGVYFSFADNLAFQPTMRSFVMITLAGLLGNSVFSCKRNTHHPSLSGKWRLLATCELTARAGEIASRIGAEVREVQVVTEMLFTYAGGLAYGGYGFALTEDLVCRLSKRETDAVIAHELGHLVHRSYWSISWVVRLLFWSAWLAAMSLAERGIGLLPASLSFLQYVKWVLLFVVPPLASMFYSRRAERGANKRLEVLDDPRAWVSANCKLAAIDLLPLHRPWWSRLTSTHPDIGDEIDSVVRAHDIGLEEVRHLLSQARLELENDTVDHYEPVYREEANEANADLVQRPDGHSYEWLLGGCTGLAILVFISSVIFYAEGQLLWMALVMTVAAGMFGGPLAIVWRLRAAARAKYVADVQKKLSERFGEQEVACSLLLDAAFVGGASWHSALVTLRDGRVLIRGLSMEEIVEGSTIKRLRTWQSRDRLLGNDAGIVVEYGTSGLAQGIALKSLSATGKDKPLSPKALKACLTCELEQMGVILPACEKLGSRRLLAMAGRTIVCLMMLGVIMWLLGYSLCAAELQDWNPFAPIAVGTLICPFLWKWVKGE